MTRLVSIAICAACLGLATCSLAMAAKKNAGDFSGYCPKDTCSAHGGHWANNVKKCSPANCRT